MAGTQLAPIVSEARTLGQFVAPTHQRLCALAQNLWWSWDDDTTSLFRRARSGAVAGAGPQPGGAAPADPDRDSSRSAPSRARAAQPDQLRLPPHARVPRRRRTPGATRHAGVLWARPVAYFSAEFGLHESLPIYSGGLGILAGDHVKSASDLGIPLIGVGLYYDQGYFRQRLDARRLAAGGVPRRRQPPAADSSRPSAGRHAGDGRDRDPHRHDSPRASGSSRSAAARCCCSIPTSTATSPKTAS